MPAKRDSTETNDTATRILDIGERLVQVRGFNGFSYADVAAELDMTKAALHYHFPGKAELGRALIERYTERFVAALADIDERIPDAPAEARRLRRPLRRRAARPAHVPVRHARRRVPDPPRPDARRGDRLHRRQRGVGREGPRRRPARGQHRRDRLVPPTPRASSSAASRERCSSRAPTATSRASTPRPRGCWRASARHRRAPESGCRGLGGPGRGGDRARRGYPRLRRRQSMKDILAAVKATKFIRA